ncbi:transporter [Ralstonia nicotianae]|uniref:Transporter n=1 Tax=Ralstonia pseudosolanacearum TaxID=1310165 RepID=A0A454TU16_9RALS|nr:transporter [Ralstonia pseudosolanacearum]AUS41950.1 transporter [Ralstonia solanacearum]AXW14632.1 transporter [Ralstonia solanacearum]AXW37969.1 transporter [Ralstonia solanacearum]AXW70816.1 transporter [Ralstonia solanacearum]AZU55500.1 transporter [Ralstonia solanacearum]
MTSRTGPGLKAIASAVGAALAFAAAGSAAAAEVDPGDYEMFPAGATIGLLYYNYATTNAYYANGNKALSNFNVQSNVGIARLLHVVKLTDDLTIDPQFLLPFGHISTFGNASALGSTNGVGDLILTAPLKLRLNQANDVLGGTIFVTAPTGSYDRNRALNLGGHRWSLDAQAAYIQHITPQWAVDLVGDVIWYGDNTSYGASGTTLHQKTSYSAQAMVRYMPDPGTSIGLGITQLWGGQTSVDGVSNNDAQRTTRLRLTAAKFVTKADQVQIQAGTDLSVRNGTRNSLLLGARYAHIF